MTIKECQEKHKKLWNWIADETERTGKIIHKRDYFTEMGIQKNPRHNCWACAYDRERLEDWTLACTKCPIDWKKYHNWPFRHTFCEIGETSPYRKWLIMVVSNDDNIELEEETVKELVRLAREIANLPFKEDEI